MFNLPKIYIQKKRFNKSLFVPKNEKQAVKKRIKDSILKATLIGQIKGEDIPSMVNETYNATAIMFLDIEIDDIKNAVLINNILQEMIKAFVIIQYSDIKGNMSLGFGNKRLSKVEKNEIVIESHFTTDIFTKHLFDQTNDLLVEYIHFERLKNKTNKLVLYSEIMVKTYIISNKSLWSRWKEILDSNIWYSHLKTMQVYDLLREIKEFKKEQSKINNTADNIKLNKKLMKLYGDMEELIHG